MKTSRIRIRTRTAALAAAMLMGIVNLTFSEDPLNGLLHKASRYVDREKYQKAFTLYKSVEPRLPSLSETVQSRIYNNMGFCAFKLKKFGAAASYYQRALERNGQYVVCLNNMAALLMNQNKYREALDYLKRADGIDARNIKVIFNTAVCLGRLRNEPEALAYFKRAFALDEKYTTRRLKSRHISDKEIRKLKDRIRALDGHEE